MFLNGPTGLIRQEHEAMAWDCSRNIRWDWLFGAPSPRFLLREIVTYNLPAGGVFPILSTMSRSGSEIVFVGSAIPHALVIIGFV